MSWRPETEAQKQKYLDLGGAKWLKKMIDKADPRFLTKDEPDQDEWQYNPETRTWSPK